MEVSFKFNNGETGKEMVSAILALFGATAGTVNVSTTAPATVATSLETPRVIAPQDNPEAGEDAGPVSNGTHDAAGVPWDARIHSEKRTTTDAGLWRKRKGCPPNQVNAVMAELQAAGKILGGAPQTTAPVAPVVSVPAGPGAVATIISPAAIVQPPAQMPLPVPTMAPVAPPAPVVETAYVKFVNFVAGNMYSPANPTGRLSEQWVSDALKSYGHVGADGNGAIQSLESAPAERVALVHQAFAQALGVAA